MQFYGKVKKMLEWIGFKLKIVEIKDIGSNLKELEALQNNYKSIEHDIVAIEEKVVDKIWQPDANNTRKLTNNHSKIVHLTLHFHKDVE